MGNWNSEAELTTYLAKGGFWEPVMAEEDGPMLEVHVPVSLAVSVIPANFLLRVPSRASDMDNIFAVYVQFLAEN